MLGNLLPRSVDNTYRGHRLALWLLGLVLFMKTGIGLGTILNGRAAAISADGIPLDTFTSAGQQAFLALFAAWGLSQVVLNLVGVVVLVRYRALVPFVFVLLLLEHLVRKGMFLILPIPRTGTAPGVFINLVLVAVMVVGLALSLWKKDASRPSTPA